jgi:hypothetical protein
MHGVLEDVVHDLMEATLKAVAVAVAHSHEK